MRGDWGRAVRGLLRRRSAACGGAVVFGVLAVALLAPMLAPHDPVDQDLSRRMKPPGQPYLLGTDDFGRDILSRIVWGSRVSLGVAAASIVIGALIGSLVGFAAGYSGGAPDHALMRAMDIMMAFPTLLLAITLVAVLGRGVGNLVVAIGVANIPQFGRIVRGEVLRIKLFDYVDAARGLGASHLRIIVRHLLPNVWPALIVLMSLRVSVAILSEASLSFLGLGIRPPAPSWGSMVAEGQKFLLLAPWMSLVPGLAIMALVLGLNLFGDGLRDALDPRLRAEGT
jgi:peptide/nickel transport system permease protein